MTTETQTGHHSLSGEQTNLYNGIFTDNISTTNSQSSLSFTENEILVQNFTSTNNPMHHLETQISLTIVYALIFVIGVVGNLSSCLVIAKNKSMHTATNYYLFNSAVADMVLLITGIPPVTYMIWKPYNYIFGPTLCFLHIFSIAMSSNATILTNTALTVERYLGICHPLLSHKMSKISRCIRTIIIIWIVAIAFTVPEVRGSRVIDDGLEENGETSTFCVVIPETSDRRVEVSAIVFFAAPMTVITVLYILIGRQLKRSVAERSFLTQENTGSTATINSPSYNNMLKHIQAQKRVIKMLVVVVAAFFVCWAPFHISRLLTVYMLTADVDVQTIYVYLYLIDISIVLYFVSTCVNPILYSIMSKKYRTAFKKTFTSSSETRTSAAITIRNKHNNVPG